jgi:hypothetical protein
MGRAATGTRLVVLEKAYLTEQMFLDPSISVADPDY